MLIFRIIFQSLIPNLWKLSKVNIHILLTYRKLKDIISLCQGFKLAFFRWQYRCSSYAALKNACIIDRNRNNVQYANKILWYKKMCTSCTALWLCMYCFLVVHLLLSGCTCTALWLYIYCSLIVHVLLSDCTCTALWLYMYLSLVVHLLLSDCTCAALWLYNVL